MVPFLCSQNCSWALSRTVPGDLSYTCADHLSWMMVCCWGLCLGPFWFASWMQLYWCELQHLSQLRNTDVLLAWDKVTWGLSNFPLLLILLWGIKGSVIRRKLSYTKIQSDCIDKAHEAQGSISNCFCKLLSCHWYRRDTFLESAELLLLYISDLPMHL